MRGKKPVCSKDTKVLGDEKREKWGKHISRMHFRSITEP